MEQVPPAEARAAMATYPGLRTHPFPGCFVCGPDRAEGDGLRIFPGPVTPASDGAVRVGAVWTPHPSTSEDFHTYVDDVPRASLPVTWAALDCTGREIVVRHPRPVHPAKILEAADLDRLRQTPATVYLTLCYREVFADPMRPLLAHGCEPAPGCEHGRVVETFQICASTTRPNPGPACEQHLAAIVDATRGERVTHILITHSHRDHCDGARGLQALVGGEILSFGPTGTERGIEESSNCTNSASWSCRMRPA